MRPWLTVLLVVLVPAIAWGDGNASGEAKAHADTAAKYFAAQAYDKAAEEWQVAYILDPVPAYLYATAQAQRLGGNCTKAILSYNAFLRTRPGDESKAKANIDRCEKELREHPPADTTTTTPVTTPVTTTPVQRPPPPPPPPAPRPDAARTWKTDWVGHALVGGGAITAVAGVFVFLSGRSAVLDNNHATTYQQFDSAHGGLGSAETRETLGASAMAIGGALIVGGVLHYAIHSRPATDTAVTATVSPGAATLAIVGAF